MEKQCVFCKWMLQQKQGIPPYQAWGTCFENKKYVYLQILEIL